MADPTVLFEVKDKVATITLNRPQALNSFTMELMEATGQALTRCQDPAIRAVVLTGTGRAFSAGADVREMASVLGAQGPDGLVRSIRRLVDAVHWLVVLPMRQLPKPIIGAINGEAVGGGLGLALACDIRIASEDARLVMAFPGIGASADSSTMYMLPRLIGQARALEMYFLNEHVDARRAMELGLFSAVVPPAELTAKADELAHKLASGPTLAYARAKQLVNDTWDWSLREHLLSEGDAITESSGTADFREGIRAFVEKRPPLFKGQ